MPARIAILAAAVAAGALAGAAGAKQPARPDGHTTAGMRVAARAVLATADLGAGWKVAGAGAKGQSLSCVPATSATDAVETGTAISPRFSRGAGGPFVTQAVWVYATDAQAAQVWATTVGRPVRSCLAESVQAGSTSTVTFAVRHEQTLALPVPGARTAAYRVVARAHATAQNIPAYVDLVLVARGNALTEISYAAFAQPVDRAVELAVARALARRL